MNILGLLLAGGQSRRMGGGDKALRPLGGRPLLQRVIDRMRPQVAALADSIPDFAGPLAGILAGLDWAAAHRPDCPIIASVATDAPFLPENLLSRLLQGMEAEGAELACAASAGQPHPVIGLWPVRLRDDLRHALVEEGVRKVDVWTSRYRLATVPFPELSLEDGSAIDPFFNANRPEDFDRAAALLDRLEVN